MATEAVLPVGFVEFCRAQYDLPEYMPCAAAGKPIAVAVSRIVYFRAEEDDPNFTFLGMAGQCNSIVVAHPYEKVKEMIAEAQKKTGARARHHARNKTTYSPCDTGHATMAPNRR